MNFLIRIKYKDKFIGYVKNYRLHRNCKYRFNKTKNIKKAMYYDEYACTKIVYKLQALRDKLYYNDNYTFDIKPMSKNEIRKSKLYLLKLKKVKNGIFKNR